MFCHSSWRIFAPRIIHGLKRLIMSLVMLLPATFFLNSIPLLAQVEWKDRYVTHAVFGQKNPTTAYPAQADYTIVVWEDERDNGSESHLYAQKIDNATGVALWDVDGVPVCPGWNSGDQRNPHAAYDSLGGVIIVWEDSRNGSEGSQRTSIYAQRLDIVTGASDPAWSYSGVLLSYPDHHAVRPRIAGTNDGVFVTWMEQENYGISSWFVFAHYLKANGQKGPGAWNTQYGLHISQNATYDETNPELTRFWEWSIDANSENRTGVAITYQRSGFTSATNSTAISNVYVSVVNPDGGIVLNGPVSQYNEDQILPQIVATGAHGAVTPRTMIIAWQDARDNPSPLLYGIWGQRMYSTGVPYGNWPIKIADAQNDPTTVVTRMFEGYSSPNDYPYLAVSWQANNEIITAGLVDANQASLVGSLKQVSYEGGTQPSADIVPINGMQANLYIGWRQTGGYSNILYQNMLLPAWTEEKDYGGWPVTQAQGNQNKPQVCGSVFVFEDNRRSSLPLGDNRNDMDISCQTPGECTGPSGMAWRDRFIQWTHGTNAQNKKMVVDRATGDFSTFVVWDEIRDGTRSVFIQKLDKNGVPRWRNSGIQLTPNGIDSKEPDVSYDGAGGAMTVCLETYNGVDALYYYRVDADGVERSHGKFSNLSSTVLQPRIARTIGKAGITYLVSFIYNNHNERRHAVLLLNQPVANIPSTPVTNGNVIYHRDLRLVGDDHYGGAYLMTNGIDANGLNAINVTFLDLQENYGVLQDELCSISTLDDYDICMDVFRRGSLLYPDAMIAYAQGSTGNMDIFLARFSPLAGRVGDLKYTSYLGANTARSPVIVSDSIDSGQGNGGCLVSWERRYVVQQTYKHDVLSNRFTWSVPAFVPQYTPDIVVSNPECTQTNLTMARINHRSPQGAPTAIIAWEDACEDSPCSPARPVSILCRQIVYPIPGPSILWNQPYQASPGPGSYTQIRPNIITHEDGSAMLIWYDTRTSDSCLMTTRMYDQDGSPGWFKPAEETKFAERSAVSMNPRFGSVFPIPFSSNTHRTLTIPWSISRDGDVRLQILDPLGRLVTTLEDDIHVSGNHVTTWDLKSYHLSPGVYFCVLSGNNSRCYTLFTVIR
jgi:hypothetical protein